MGKIGKHGKVLGPKGLTSKSETWNSNWFNKSSKRYKVWFSRNWNDKDGNLASTIGRKSFSSDKLLENYTLFYWKC